MSGLPDYPTDSETAYPIYTYASAEAIRRVEEHWARWDFNMWEVYHSELSRTWIDPWFEHEINGINNSAPEYEQTQNMFYIYNWLTYKGYHKYAMVALITSAIQSSTLTGGLWQSQVHPYAAIEDFNPIETTANQRRYPWYIQSQIAYWEQTVCDEYLQENVTLTATGTWPAVRKYDIAMTAETIDGHTYYRPDYDNGLHWNVGSEGHGYPNEGVGYGLVQWTNYTIITAKAEATTPEGGKHWQLNLTLQLMMMEFERVQAMTQQGHQQGTDYLGEWVDDNAGSAFITLDGHIYHYPNESCTWNDWRDDKPVAIFEQYMSTQYGIQITEWDKRHIMMDIYRVCYLHTSYHDFDFELKSQYVWNAITYWDNTIGWDPKWIPRARDIPECELDYFHVNPNHFVTIAGRRKKQHARRTILL